MRSLFLLAAMAVGAPALAAGCQLGRLAELPVTMRGLRPTVMLGVNGQQLPFLADSGAFMSVITPASARQLGLKENDVPGGLYMTGVGGRVETTMVTVKDLTLAGQTFHGVYFLVGGSEVGGDSIGVVGQNVLGMFDTEYDLAGGTIRLIKPQGCGKGVLAYWAGDRPVQRIPIAPVTPVDKHIYGTVEVNGVKLRAIFDTGAAISMITRAGAGKAGVRPGDPNVQENGMTGGIGRRLVQSWIAPFASFRLDGEEVKQTRIRIGDVPDAEFDMVVGADFFLSHRVYVSNAQRMMYITYNGGPVFQLEKRPATTPADDAGGPAPVDADGLGRRGAARMARHDYDGAIADLDRAIVLAPKEPRYLVQRAEAWLLAREPLRAKADLDAALALDPRNADALLARAGLYLVDRDRAAAREDLVAAAKVVAPQADMRLTIAQMLSAAQARTEAIEQYGLWLDAHRVDNKRPEALNGRCWARALAGRELPQALEDCNAALRWRPGVAGFLDSRGLVRLRMGDTTRAIADYDAALAINPKIAWSLYGRGLAKIRSGDADNGRKDIAAALAIDPQLTVEARRDGIVPPDGDPR